MKNSLSSILVASVLVAASSSSVNAAPKFVFSPYKDVAISMNWWDALGGFTNVMSTKAPSGNTGSLMPLANSLPSGINTVTWAFATGDCSNENWAGISANDFIGPNVKSFVNSNVNYIVSTGGAAGGFTCSDANQMAAFIDRYASPKFVGIDFDIEGGHLNNEQITSLVNSIAQVKSRPQYANLRVSFTVATLGATINAGKEGSSISAAGETVMRAIVDSKLTDYTVNLMAMDYGSVPSGGICVVENGKCDMGKSAIQAAENFLKEFDGTTPGKARVQPNQVELTVLTAVNDIPNEVFSLSDAAVVARYVKSKSLGGLHYWSYDRDTSCDVGTFQLTCGGIPQAPLEFADTFITHLKLH